MTKRLSVFIKAYLSAFALTVTFQAPLQAADYEDRLDFIIASVYELLGEYQFRLLLVAGLIAFVYWYMEKQGCAERERGFSLLASFFAFVLLLGNSYAQTGSWDYCFGSVVNLIKTMIAFAGYFFLFRLCLGELKHWLEGHSFVEKSGKDGKRARFFGKHCFRNSFCVILASWAPFLVLSWPGNLCWDVIGQIEQVILNTGYTTHHPLAHTLLVGGLVKLGQVLFSSYEIGLAVYVWLQTIMLAAAMAATVAVLARRNARPVLVVCLLVIYCITPAYSNIASTAIKDVPFCAFVVGYVVCYALLLETPDLLKNRRFVAIFILMQMGVVLFRNNGLPLVVLCGLGGFLFLSFKVRCGGRTAAFAAFFGGAVLGQVILLLLIQLTGASAGSRGEMLSVPFQQTARYLQLYQDKLSDEERAAIEAVLGDVTEVAMVYDPEISDPVKSLFNQDASARELIAYFRIWLRCFFKHPAVYFEAFFVHVYGWFTPSVSNVIRYEVQDYDTIYHGGLFANAYKLLIFYYRYIDRVSILGALENIGLAVWSLFFISSCFRKERRYALLCTTLPQWVSLLVCMASPCCIGHPRYAFPILFTMPFLYGFWLTAQSDSAPAGEKNMEALQDSVLTGEIAHG
ncbi:MAG: DUF6020 family protein [Lachnospiraceae bacterium]|nr:DUF6020 family protein [Lachnospiraceae bacterium]